MMNGGKVGRPRIGLIVLLSRAPHLGSVQLRVHFSQRAGEGQGEERT